MIFGQKSKENVNLGTKVLTVVKSRCPQNHYCPALKTCPTQALTQKGFSAPEVDHEKCIGCAKCARYCPMGALVLS